MPESVFEAAGKAPPNPEEAKYEAGLNPAAMPESALEAAVGSTLPNPIPA
jgi:hypothetical protein